MKIIKQDLEIDFIYRSVLWIMEWRKKHLLHREDGPASIMSGRPAYYLNNKFYDEDDYWKKIHENY